MKKKLEAGTEEAKARKEALSTAVLTVILMASGAASVLLLVVVHLLLLIGADMIPAIPRPMLTTWYTGS